MSPSGKKVVTFLHVFCVYLFYQLIVIGCFGKRTEVSTRLSVICHNYFLKKGCYPGNLIKINNAFYCSLYLPLVVLSFRFSVFDSNVYLSFVKGNIWRGRWSEPHGYASLQWVFHFLELFGCFDIVDAMSSALRYSVGPSSKLSTEAVCKHQDTYYKICTNYM